MEPILKPAIEKIIFKEQKTFVRFFEFEVERLQNKNQKCRNFYPTKPPDMKYLQGVKDRRTLLIVIQKECQRIMHVKWLSISQLHPVWKLMNSDQKLFAKSPEFNYTEQSRIEECLPHQRDQLKT